MDANQKGLTLDRLKAFSDGVFAIVLTVLVLELEAPDTQGIGIRELLVAMEPQLRSYISSFACITVFWITQVVIIHYIDHTDRTFIWLNVLLFLPVSLAPFLTELRTTHMGNPSMAWLSGGTQVAALLILLGIWRYATQRLRTKPLSRDVVRSLDLRIYAAIGLYLLGAMLAPWNERVATLCFLLGLLPFFNHQKLDREAVSS